MIAELNPALILVIGALLLPLLPRSAQGWGAMALPLLGLGQLLLLGKGEWGQIEFLGHQLVTLRIDHLSYLWGIIFFIAAFLGALYAKYQDDVMQLVAGGVYAGAAIGAAFAGDLVTLFVWWELTAISSVFLIWANRTERAYKVGMRYLIIQVGSGVILLFGLLVHVHETGSVAFEHLGLESLGGKIIFVAFGIKCAFPFLHNWLQDAYPEATVVGTVFLSAFTTKLAVYALARGYAGTEELIWIGATMTAFPIFFAVIENDLRRVLAYSLNNQLGFMVVGIGVGTELALNGTAAHAFCHILYKALLFMSMGAVLLRTGTANGSELGGLYKSMPWTAAFCIVGAASISAFPLFSGFVSKSLIMSATAQNGYVWVWLMLLFASAGVFHHSGIKIPFFAFFAHDSGKRCKEAPGSMLWAMGIAAALCIGIGIYPAPLYAILPFDVDYVPYTTSHVITQLQVLMFSALAFGVLFRSGIYPPELKSTNLDFDWTYRKLLPAMWRRVAEPVAATRSSAERNGVALAKRGIGALFQLHGPEGILARTAATGAMGLLALIALAGGLFLFLS